MAALAHTGSKQGTKKQKQQNNKTTKKRFSGAAVAVALRQLIQARKQK